jgi:hypothetical protein
MTHAQINNRDASITLPWADKNYTFHLPWDGIIELQEKLDAGPNYILTEMWQGNWKVEYISEIIRIGLIGGGLTPSEALNLVERYVKSRPPMENLSIAQAILAISLQGAPEEKGEAQAAPENNNSTIFQEEK